MNIPGQTVSDLPIGIKRTKAHASFKEVEVQSVSSVHAIPGKTTVLLQVPSSVTVVALRFRNKSLACTSTRISVQ